MPPRRVVGPGTRTTIHTELCSGARLAEVAAQASIAACARVHGEATAIWPEYILEPMPRRG